MKAFARFASSDWVPIAQATNKLMARQVRPWLAKPVRNEALRVRLSDWASASKTHQGNLVRLVRKIRMYRRNLFLCAATILKRGKPGASIYVSANLVDCHA